MNFKDFEAKFVAQNRKLWIALVGSICISAVTLAVSFWSNSYFIFSGGEVFKERPLAEHICKRGVETIAKGEPHPFFVSDGIIELLDSEDPFLIDIKKILRLKSTEKNKCHIILKDERSVRAFRVSLIADESFPFYYKLNQLDEVEVKEN